MADHFPDQTRQPVTPTVWLWLIVSGGLLLLLSWFLRFPWSW